MNKREDAKINMFQTVQIVCNENKSVVDSDVAFAASYSSFQTQLDSLYSTGSKGINVITGITGEKSSEKDNLSFTANLIAGKLFAFAVKSNNAVLKAQSSFALSELQNTKDAQLPMICANIASQALTYLASLTDYGITQAIITDFETAIAKFKKSSSAPRASITNRKTQNAQIKKTIKEIDNILREEMNKLAFGFKKGQPAFYATYLNAQLIINTALRHRKPLTDEQKAARKAARLAKKEALLLAIEQGKAIEAANQILQTPPESSNNIK